MKNNNIVTLFKYYNTCFKNKIMNNFGHLDKKLNVLQSIISSSKTLTIKYNKLKYGTITFICNYIIFLSSISTFAFTIDTPIIEGSLIKGTQKNNEKIYLGQTLIPAAPNGDFYFGLPQDAVKPLKLKIITSTDTKEVAFPIQKRKWEEQRINGLPKSKVNISSQNQKRIQNENKQLRLERTKTINTFFPACFIRPVNQPYRISGSFGNRRIFNNQVPAGHSGTDYAAPKGTPTYAIADGIVVVTHPDMFLSGKTVLINHGYGIFTAYSHLNDINVKSGQSVKQGDIIGKIGATGRATGPHLHFTMTWYTTRVDPEQVLTNFACSNK